MPAWRSSPGWWVLLRSSAGIGSAETSKHGHTQSQLPGAHARTTLWKACCRCCKRMVRFPAQVRVWSRTSPPGSGLFPSSGVSATSMSLIIFRLFWQMFRTNRLSSRLPLSSGRNSMASLAKQDCWVFSLKCGIEGLAFKENCNSLNSLYCILESTCCRTALAWLLQGRQLGATECPEAIEDMAEKPSRGGLCNDC